MVASTERTLHRYDRMTAKSRFRRQMRAARWTTPSLRLQSVVTGTSQLPAPFEPNPTLLRPPLLSQCPTQSMGDILPHSVFDTNSLHRVVFRHVKTQISLYLFY